MNLFYLDKPIDKCAEAHVDRHVVKMIVEAAQLLSTAHRVLDGEEYYDKTSNGRNIKRWRLYDEREDLIYKATHVNHPCARWTRETVNQYLWTYEYFMALMEEYEYRYGKRHKCLGYFSMLLGSPPHNLKKMGWSDPPAAMPDEYKTDDVMESYRNYYREGKKHLHSWKHRDPPVWLSEN